MLNTRRVRVQSVANGLIPDPDGCVEGSKTEGNARAVSSRCTRFVGVGTMRLP